MTKWARIRKRKERRKAEQEPTNSVSEESEIKLTEQETTSNKTKQKQQTQKLETSHISKSNPILSQIPRYVYLVAIFALLSGVFFPLITTGSDAAYNFVIGGAATLFLGLAGGILLFKAATSDKSQIIFVAVGLGLISISLVLVYVMIGLWALEFVLR